MPLLLRNNILSAMLREDNWLDLEQQEKREGERVSEGKIDSLLEEWKRFQRELQYGKELEKFLSDFENEEKRTIAKIELNLCELKLIYAQLRATALLTNDVRSADLASKILQVLEKHWKRMRSYKQLRKFLAKRGEQG